MLTRIIEIIFPVFTVAAIGWLYTRRKPVDLAMLNTINMDVLSPLLVFWALTSKPFTTAEFLDLSLGGVVVILGSGVLLLPVIPLLSVQIKTFLPPMMFTNVANMGIPLALSAFGESALQAAVLLFVIEMALHFTIGLYILDHRTRPWVLLRMPIVAAMGAGLLCALCNWRPPAPLLDTAKLLGEAAIPLMLFTLGARFSAIGSSHWRLGLWGALLCPLSGVIAALLIIPWLDLSPTQTGQLLLYGALPPAVLNYLVAERYQQEPEKVAAIVLIGNLGSLIAVPLILFFALPQ